MGVPFISANIWAVLVDAIPESRRICTSLVERLADDLVLLGVGGFARFVAACIAVLVASSCLYCSRGLLVTSVVVELVALTLRASICASKAVNVANESSEIEGYLNVDPITPNQRKDNIDTNTAYYRKLNRSITTLMKGAKLLVNSQKGGLNGEGYKKTTYLVFILGILSKQPIWIPFDFCLIILAFLNFLTIFKFFVWK